ncbi:hypothetical protein Tco_1512916, partial [Tanacetum coccineum]
YLPFEPYATICARMLGFLCFDDEPELAVLKDDPSSAVPEDEPSSVVPEDEPSSPVPEDEPSSAVPADVRGVGTRAGPDDSPSAVRRLPGP